MRAVDLLHGGLSTSHAWMLGLLKDIESEPLRQPTAAGGNHPMWIIGHLAYIEGGMKTVLLGEPNPVEGWHSLFAAGSTPSTDPAIYPPFSEVVARFSELRHGTLRMLGAMNDAQLDLRPPNVPPGFEEAMRTIGETLMLLCMHQMFHQGQLSDVRRAAGIPPRM